MYCRRLQLPPLSVAGISARLTESRISQNTFYYGDNLSNLRTHVPDESVDLIYLDPPFNSSRTYNLLFKQHKGDTSPAQIMAAALWYTPPVMDVRSSAIERVVHQLGQCLTPDTARRIAGLRADRELQKKTN